MWRRIMVASLLVVMWLSVVQVWAETYRWSMVRFGGKEVNNTVASGTNDAGWIVGNWYGHANPDDPGGAFRFQKNTFTPFAIPGAVSTEPADIDKSTKIVGNFTLPDGSIHAFYYRHGNPPAMDVIDVPGAIWTFPFRVNTLKQIALGYFWSDGVGTFWSAAVLDFLTGQLTPITIDGAADLVIRGLNNNGEMVGSFTILDPNNPCQCQFWDNGFYRNAAGEVFHLTTPDGGPLFPSSINDHGIMVGQTWYGTGFRWDLNTGAFEDIVHPSRNGAGFSTAVVDVDNTGRMVAINKREADAYIESWWVRPTSTVSAAANPESSGSGLSAR